MRSFAFRGASPLRRSRTAYPLPIPKREGGEISLRARFKEREREKWRERVCRAFGYAPRASSRCSTSSRVAALISPASASREARCSEACSRHHFAMCRQISQRLWSDSIQVCVWEAGHGPLVTESEPERWVSRPLESRRESRRIPKPPLSARRKGVARAQRDGVRAQLVVARRVRGLCAREPAAFPQNLSSHLAFKMPPQKSNGEKGGAK